MSRNNNLKLKMASITLLSTLTMSTVMQAYPVVLQWNYEQGLVHADNVSDDQVLADWTIQANGQTLRLVDSSFIGALLNSPAGDGKTLAQVTGKTASTLKISDLSKLTAVDLSTSAFSTIGATVSADYSKYGYNGFWVSTQGGAEIETPMASALFYALSKANNATSLDVAGLFQTPGQVGYNGFGKALAAMIDNAKTFSTNATLNANSGNLTTIFPKLTSLDISYTGFKDANDAQNWSWFNSQTDVKVYVGSSGTWISDWLNGGGTGVRQAAENKAKSAAMSMAVEAVTKAGLSLADWQKNDAGNLNTALSSYAATNASLSALISSVAFASSVLSASVYTAAVPVITANVQQDTALPPSTQLQADSLVSVKDTIAAVAANSAAEAVKAAASAAGVSDTSMLSSLASAAASAATSAVWAASGTPSVAVSHVVDEETGSSSAVYNIATNALNDVASAAMSAVNTVVSSVTSDSSATVKISLKSDVFSQALSSAFSEVNLPTSSSVADTTPSNGVTSSNTNSSAPSSSAKPVGGLTIGASNVTADPKAGSISVKASSSSAAAVDANYVTASQQVKSFDSLMSAFNNNPQIGADTDAGSAKNYASTAKSIFDAAKTAYDTASNAAGKISNADSLAALQKMMQSAFLIEQKAADTTSLASVAADSAVTKSEARSALSGAVSALASAESLATQMASDAADYASNAKKATTGSDAATIAAQASSAASVAASALVTMSDNAKTIKDKSAAAQDNTLDDAVSNYNKLASSAAAAANAYATGASTTASSMKSSEAAAASEASKPANSSSAAAPSNSASASTSASSQANSANSTAISAYAKSVADAYSTMSSARSALYATTDYTKLSSYASLISSATKTISSVNDLAKSVASNGGASTSSTSAQLSNMASDLGDATTATSDAKSLANQDSPLYQILGTYSVAASAALASAKSYASAGKSASGATSIASIAGQASAAAARSSAAESTAKSLLATIPDNLRGAGVKSVMSQIDSANDGAGSYAKAVSQLADSQYASLGSAAGDGHTTSIQYGILKTYSSTVSSAALAAQNADTLTKATSNGKSASSYAAVAASAASVAASAASAIDSMLQSIGADGDPGSAANQIGTDGDSYAKAASSAATDASSLAAANSSSAANWTSGGLGAIASSLAVANGGTQTNVVPTYKKAKVDQTLPKGVNTNTTLKSWGLPEPFIKAILNQSMTFDGNALSSHVRDNTDGNGSEFTVDNITFGDLMYISKLDLSDKKHDNGIYDYFQKTQSWQLSIYSADTWQNASSFNWNNGQQLFASFDAIIMSTTGQTSLDLSSWKSSKDSPANKNTQEDANWASSFGYLNLANLPNLAELSVAYDDLGNQLFGGQDFQMFHNDSLTTLDISGNIMTSLGGSSGSSKIVTGYPKLVNLNMSNMAVMNTFPPELNNANNDFAKRIQSLQIDNDNFTTLPSWITVAAQNGLIILTATGNQLTSADSKLLQKPSSLEYLDLTGQDGASSGLLDSFFLDNSGTQAIQQYNKIMNDPEMQIWLANDPNGALAQQVAALRKQIQDRAGYQATLNDYTDLLARAELDPSQQSVTVTVTVTTSVVVNGQSYTVKLPYDPDHPYDANNPAQQAQLQALALSQLQSQHPELADLTTDDLNIASVKTPLTTSDLVDYIEKHKDETSVSTYYNADGTPTDALKKLQTAAEENPHQLASYGQLPPAPKPSEYAVKDAQGNVTGTVPSYYDTQGALLGTIKQAAITDATITVAKIQQVQDQLVAAGDTEGAKKLQEQIDSVQKAINDIPVTADVQTDSNFFYVRSLTKQIQTSTDTATTVATEKTISQLNDAQTVDLIKKAVDSGKLSNDAGDKLITAGSTSLIDLAKDQIQTAVDGGSITDEMGHKLTDGATSVQDIRNNINEQMNTKDSTGKGMLDNTTGNNLLDSIDAAVSQGQGNFTTNVADAVAGAVAQSVASSVASQAGLSSEAQASLADQLKSAAVTDTDEVAKALTTDTSNGGVGGGLLNADGTVDKDSAEKIKQAVSEAQSAIAPPTPAASSDKPDDTQTVAPATGDFSIAGVVAPNVPFNTYTSSKMFDTLIPTQSVATAATTNMAVNVMDTRNYRGNLNVTATLSAPFAMTGDNNAVLTGAEVVMSKSALATSDTDSAVFSSGTSTAMGGLKQANGAVVKQGQATTVATGQVDSGTTLSKINFNNVYLRIPTPTKGGFPATGKYAATMTWTVNAAQDNGMGDTK